MPRFRKKPVVVEAKQWDGSEDSAAEIVAWADSQVMFSRYTKAGGGNKLVVCTLEGTMQAGPGWWVIRGVKGEYYPCEPEIFELTYEPEPEETKRVTEAEWHAEHNSFATPSEPSEG